MLTIIFKKYQLNKGRKISQFYKMTHSFTLMSDNGNKQLKIKSSQNYKMQCVI